LSPVNYFKNNKKSFISSIIAISLSIILVYGIDCFLESMYTTIFNFQCKIYEKAISINAVSESNLIKDELINKIQQNEYIEKVIPIKTLNIRYNTVASTTYLPIYGLLNNDRGYLMDKYKIFLKEGRLPEEGEKEVALDSRVALNNKLKLGDLWEEYEVVGIMKSEYYLSFSSFSSSKEEADMVAENSSIFTDKLIKTYAMVFPKDGYYEKGYELLSTFLKEDIEYLGIKDVTQGFVSAIKSAKQIFDALIILIIIVNVVTLACTKYTQFVNRKSEYGILNSLGYKRQEIMKMSFKEVVLLNIIAYFVGIILAVFIAYLLTKGAFESTGGIMIFIKGRSFLLSMLTPLFASIFTLIPIFRSLGNMDGISIIEEV
jgi:putative ABC transport system permease protein